MGSVNLDEEKIKILFPLTSDWNSAVHSKMNIGDTVINGHWTPRMFVNFNNFQYFMYLNTFLSEGFHRFHKIFKEAHGTKKFKNPWSKQSIPNLFWDQPSPMKKVNHQTCSVIMKTVQKDQSDKNESLLSGSREPETLSLQLWWAGLSALMKRLIFQVATVSARG